MKVRKHFPLDENLLRAKVDEAIENVEIEGTLAEGQQLFHDLNRIMSLVDVAREHLGEIDGEDGESYRRLHALLESLQPIVG